MKRMVLGVVAVTGCYVVAPVEPCTLTCSANQACPEGQVCGGDQRCKLPDATTCSCPDDDFEGTELDAAKWELTHPMSPIEPEVADGALSLDLPDNTTPLYFGIQAQRTMSFSDNSIEVDFLENVSPAGFVEAALVLQHSDTDRYIMSHGAGTFNCGATVANTFEGNQPPYDPARHKVWKIATVGPAVTFETSPDGLTWETCFSNAADVPLSALRVALFVGRFSAGNPMPGVARVDYVRIGTCP